MTEVFATERLVLRELEDADANFIHQLYTGSDFRRAIGDRGISSLADAADYLKKVLQNSYREHGFGLWLMEFEGQGVGVCGLVKRDYLPVPDLGFALVPEAYGQGFAREAAAACLSYARAELGLPELLAIASMDNEASHKLLQAVGFKPNGMIIEPRSKESLCCFRWTARWTEEGLNAN
ncbi:GNAT family N-acetyltransferase [Pseudidiomarina halophila]|uniref:GNAT family N-acetyltransferase n=1 Tax=Pseudidiomarina halophila TaxID=1449799 RepID=UPI00361473C8